MAGPASLGIAGAIPCRCVERATTGRRGRGVPQIIRRRFLLTKSRSGASRPRLDSPHQGSPEGNKKPHQPGEWMTMLALVEGHPNIDVMIFYVVASAILAATLYYFHHKQTE